MSTVSPMAEFGIAMDGRAPVADIPAQARAADLKAAGIGAPRPLKTIAEAIAICRSLLAGEMTEFKGQVFEVSGRRLAGGARNVPIVLAASRPNMLRLAGRATDGVLISAAT